MRSWQAGMVLTAARRVLFAEVHILWAQHQVHHSSEDYNLSVGLRQSVLQGWCGFVSTYHVSHG